LLNLVDTTEIGFQNVFNVGVLKGDQTTFNEDEAKILFKMLTECKF
jgi:hypothetical protein